jgi:hypothetical protein
MMLIMICRDHDNLVYYGKAKSMTIPAGLDLIIRTIYRVQPQATIVVVKMLESIPVCEEQSIHADVWATVEGNQNIQRADMPYALILAVEPITRQRAFFFFYICDF